MERIVVREFNTAERPQALAILQEFGKQEWMHPGASRVRLAILKLANGNMTDLRRYTRVAIENFRDVLSQAEYPRYTTEVGFNATPEYERKVIDDDWRQYREWLEKE